MKSNSRMHYGWVVCIASTLAMFCCTGMIINAFSVYMPYLVEKFSLSQTEASLVTTFRSLFSLIFKFVVLWFITRLNVRKTMMLGFACITGAFVCYALAPNVIWVYAAASLSGIGYGLATMVPISILLNRWFREKLAMAVAVCAASTGVASMLLPTAITKIIETSGLSAAFLAEGAAVLLLCAVAALLIRNEPSEMGLLPFGAKPGEAQEKKAVSEKESDEKVLSRRQKNIFMVAPLFLGAVTQTLPSLFTLHFVGQGFDPMQAAMAVSVYGFMLLVGKFAYGFASDLMGSSKTNYMFLLFQLAGVALGCVIKGYAAVLYASVILIGLGSAVSTVGITMWAKDFSNAKEYDSTVRLYQILFMLGSLVLSPCTGMVADAFGNYVPVFALFSLMTVVILAALVWAYRAKRLNRSRQ